LLTILAIALAYLSIEAWKDFEWAWRLKQPKQGGTKPQQGGGGGTGGGGGGGAGGGGGGRGGIDVLNTLLKALAAKGAVDTYLEIKRYYETLKKQKQKKCPKYSDPCA